MAKVPIIQKKNHLNKIIFKANAKQTGVVLSDKYRKITTYSSRTFKNKTSLLKKKLFRYNRPKRIMLK